MPKRTFSRGSSSARKRARREEQYSEDEDLVDYPIASKQEEDPDCEEQDHDEIRPNEPQPVSGSVENGAVLEHSDEEEEYEDSEDEDEDEEQVQASINLSQKRGFSHSGILDSVELHRFMCHDFLKYELGPNVNIINGKNGSGKSAIVAALQIGLGARANATERATKLADHIKHGENSAIIVIKIRNRKPPQVDDESMEADLTYKHDEYGDAIIIERKLARNGRGSGWAVKGKNGRFIKLPPGTTPAMEISSITDHFGFMVSNPVSILTQTKAKQFLAGRKASDHYKLYREATLLDPLELELERTKAALKDVRRRLEYSEQGLPKSKMALEKLEAAYHEAKELKNINERIRETSLLWAWTVVDEHERELSRMQKITSRDFEPEKEKALKDTNDSQKRIDDLNLRETEESQSLQEATRKSHHVLEEYRKAQKEGKKLTLELDLQRKRIVNSQSDAKAAARSVQRTRERMEDARRKHFAGQEQKSEIVKEIQDLKTTEESYGESIRNTKLRVNSQGDQAMHMDSDLTRIASDNDRLKYHFEEKLKEQRQAEVMARNRNSLYRFGAQVPVVDKLISQNEHLFDRKPVGPIGQYVSLHDESWAPAVEVAIGTRTISTFIVHSSRDARTLKNLFDREKRKMRREQAGRMRMPGILVSDLNRERYTIGRDNVPDVYNDGLKTILDAVNIRNDAVFNALVDQSMIERVVLDDKNEDVTTLGWSRIPNLAVVWNKRCERAYTRNGSNTFRKAPGRNMTARFLTQDVTRYLESLRDEVQKLQDDQKACEDRLTARKRDRHQLQSQIRDLRRQIDEAQHSMFEAQRKRSQLEDQLSQAENAFDARPFEEEIASFEEDRRQHEQALEAANVEVIHIQEKQQEFSTVMETAKANHVSARAETVRLSKKLTDLHNDIAKLKSRHRHLQKQYEAASQKLTTAYGEIEHMQATIVERSENARDFGQQPEGINSVELPSAKVQRKVTGLKKKLEAEQERRGGLSAEDIEERYLKGKKKFNETVDLQKRIRHYEKCLKRGIRNRTEKHRELSRNLKLIVRNNFKWFLAKKGHNGNVKFSRNDSGEMELHLSTKMKNHVLENGERHETKQLAALSGGEKSLTTLSFMLAMAELCQNPLRVYDEIDVYQDDATRRTSYRMLIDFCSEYLSHRQIILITPCNLPEIDESPSVKMVRMPDPRPDNHRRRQTRLHEFSMRDE